MFTTVLLTCPRSPGESNYVHRLRNTHFQLHQLDRILHHLRQNADTAAAHLVRQNINALPSDSRRHEPRERPTRNTTDEMSNALVCARRNTQSLSFCSDDHSRILPLLELLTDSPLLSTPPRDILHPDILRPVSDIKEGGY